MDASHQNPYAERPHQSIGVALRAALYGASMDFKYWPFAFYLFLRMHNCSPHGDHEMSPEEIVTAICPHLAWLRTFGCHVWTT